MNEASRPKTRTQTAVILAAGVGERLRPLTDERPKCLVEVAGRTIIERTLDVLASYGVRRVVVATGYLEDVLRGRLREAPMPVEYAFNPEYASTQNMVSLALCREAVGDDSFFKLDGDVLFPEEVLHRLDLAEAPMAVAVDTSRKLDAEAMKVQVEGDRIATFGKHISVSTAFGETMGIERIDSSLTRLLFSACAEACAEGRTDVYYEAIYAELLGPRVRGEAVDMAGVRWTEVDDRADLAEAERLFG